MISLDTTIQVKQGRSFLGASFYDFRNDICYLITELRNNGENYRIIEIELGGAMEQLIYIKYKLDGQHNSNRLHLRLVDRTKNEA